MSAIINIFLENKDKQIIQIMNYLFEQQDTETTSNDIAKKMGLTTLLVKGLLETYQILNLSECGIIIDVIEKKKIQFQINDYSENRLQQLLVQKNYLFKLCELLFNHTFKSLDDFSNENYVSIATMYRKLKLLKELLTGYDITLNLGSDCYLDGEEHHIRHFYYELFYLGYGLTDGYSDKDLTKLITFTDQVPFPVVKRIKMLAFITEQRIKNDYFIEKKIFFSSVHNSIANEKEIRNVCLLILPEHLTSKQKELEIDFMTMYIITLDIVSIAQFKNLTNVPLLMGNSYFELIREWILQLLTQFNINVSAEVYFFLVANLYYHLFRKDILGAASQNYLDIEDIYSDKSVYISNISKKVIVFLNSVYYIFPDSFINKDFYYMLIREAFVHSNKTVTICVFSGTAQTHKKIIEDNINRYSLVPVKFNDSISQNVDLIVSDSYFEVDKSNFVTGDAIIFISRYPSLEEYSIVIKKVLSIFESKNG